MRIWEAWIEELQIRTGYGRHGSRTEGRRVGAASFKSLKKSLTENKLHGMPTRKKTWLVIHPPASNLEPRTLVEYRRKRGGRGNWHAAYPRVRKLSPTNMRITWVITARYAYHYSDMRVSSYFTNINFIYIFVLMSATAVFRSRVSKKLQRQPMS